MSACDNGRWDEWHQRVFPTLEATLLAAGLSRTLGIVCFHPCYLTPDRRVLLSALECQRSAHRVPTECSGVPTERSGVPWSALECTQSAHAVPSSAHEACHRVPPLTIAPDCL